jgi:predicted O-methyltransferase YrrM
MTAMARSLSEQAPTASSEPPTAGYAFSTDWVSFHVDLWRRTFGHLAGWPGMAILEVGCFEGRATVWMLKTLLTDPSARITCVDTFAGSFEHPLMGLDLNGIEARFDHNIRTSGDAEKVSKLKGRSGDVLRRLDLNSFDLAYIDGSHLARDVLEDAVLAFGLLKSAGFMIFDDYNWDRLRDDPRHPRFGIDAFLKVYAAELAVRHVGYQVIVQKT